MESVLIERDPWEQPLLVFEGKVDEVVLGGVAKLSIHCGDPGDVGELNSPPGQRNEDGTCKGNPSNP